MADDKILREREERRRMMLEDPVYKVIPILAVPTVISMLIDSFYNMADTYFVSQLGLAATAAVGVNDSLMMMLRAVAMGFGMGAASYISRLLGAKRDEDACRVGMTSLVTAMLVSVVLLIFGTIFTEPLVILLGSTETSMIYSMQYARFILLAAPFTAGEVVLSQLLRSEGSTKYSMFGMVSGCVLNIILDPIFINVFHLEVAGAAMATALSKVVSFMVLLSPFLRKRTMLELRRQYFTPRWSIYKEVGRMGIPSFLRSMLLSVSTVVTNNMAAGFGDTALAAVSVANKCMRFLGAAIIGFAQGFAPVAGYCWGAKRYKGVMQSFWFTSFMGFLIAVICGAIMAIEARALVSVITTSTDPDILAIGSFMIRAQCLTMTAHMWVVIVSNFFQSLGMAFNSTVLNLSRQVICLIPLVILLSMTIGVYGLASAQAVSDVLSMIISLPLFMKLRTRILKLEKETAAEEAAAASGEV